MTNKNLRIKDVFEKHKGHSVLEFALHGGRAGSASVATLTVSFAGHSKKAMPFDVNLNFRRWRNNGRVNFKEVGDGCLISHPKEFGKEIEWFDCSQYETQTSYFEQCKLPNQGHESLVLNEIQAEYSNGQESWIVINFGLKKANASETLSTHFVRFNIELDSISSQKSSSATTILTPYLEEMPNANLYANSIDFELYFTETYC